MKIKRLLFLGFTVAILIWAVFTAQVNAASFGDKMVVSSLSDIPYNWVIVEVNNTKIDPSWISHTGDDKYTIMYIGGAKYGEIVETCSQYNRPPEWNLTYCSYSPEGTVCKFQYKPALVLPPTPPPIPMKDLGILGESSSALGINNNGQVIGRYTVSSSQPDHAFIWENNKMSDLGSLAGNGAFAYGINDKNQVVGEANASDKTWHAFIWENGKMTDLGSGGAHGINEKGHVVGYYTSSDYSHHACIWQDGKMSDLGLSSSNSEAFAINEKDQIVGKADTSHGNWHAFIWENGKMTDLGTLGGSWSEAYGINDKGQVVGISGTSNEPHAFIWEDGEMTDLGTLGGDYSAAYGINDKGQVVGEASTQDSSHHAFAWSNGKMTDLGREAKSSGINDNGQIVGTTSTSDGIYHASILQYPDSPLSILAIGPSDGSIFNTSKITVNASDNVASNSIKLQYSLDGTNWNDIYNQNTDNLTEGLIAWYKFEGNTNDSTINKSHGQKSSTGTITYAKGINGQGARFDGNQSYILLPTMTNKLEQGSISLYFRPDEWDATKGLSFLFSSSKNPPPDGYTDGVNLGMHAINTGTSNLLFGIYDSGWNWANSGFTPQPNEWYHVVCTWSKSGIKMYINGIKQQENPYNNGAQSEDNYDIIGGSSWPNSFFKGTIDDFKIYNKALSDEEVKKLYVSGGTTEFIWDTSLFKGSSVKVRATAVDTSGNENIISPEYTYIIPSTESSLGETHVNAASLSNISVDIGDKKLSSIMNGKGNLRDIDYYVSGSTVTIRKSYLQYYFNKFPDHNLYLNFVFKDGSSSIFTVYTGTTPHVVLTDALSYKLGSGDAELSFSPNGNFITSVKNGNTLLVPRIDYTYSPSTNIFYIRRGYLNSCFSKALDPLKIIAGFTGDSPKSVVITPVK